MKNSPDASIEVECVRGREDLTLNMEVECQAEMLMSSCPGRRKFTSQLEVKEKSSVARNLPVGNLLPQNVGSSINCMQYCY